MRPCASVNCFCTLLWTAATFSGLRLSLASWKIPWTSDRAVTILLSSKSRTSAAPGRPALVSRISARASSRALVREADASSTPAPSGSGACLRPHLLECSLGSTHSLFGFFELLCCWVLWLMVTPATVIVPTKATGTIQLGNANLLMSGLLHVGEPDAIRLNPIGPDRCRPRGGPSLTTPQKRPKAPAIARLGRRARGAGNLAEGEGFE